MKEKKSAFLFEQISLQCNGRFIDTYTYTPCSKKQALFIIYLPNCDHFSELFYW